MWNRIKLYLDTKFVPSWRMWWKLWSMRFGAVFAALVTYLTIVPNALKDALDSLPPFLRDSIPAWIGPVLFVGLFIVRFWNQSHPSKDQDHGAN